MSANGIKINRITNANIYINGVTCLGKAEEVKLPDVNVVMQEHKALGMFGKLNFPAGIDKMEGEIKWNSFYEDVAKLMAADTRVRNLNYKTIRHPGHRDAMHLLLHGLRLIERRDLLREVLEGAVPHSRDDMVIIAAMANGMRAGRLEQLTHTARIFGGLLRGKQRTAIELTTAAGMLGAVELFATGQLPQQGFVRQEQCTLPALLATRSGAYFQSLLR